MDEKMFKYFKTKIKDKEYLIKSFEDSTDILAVNINGKFQTSINMDSIKEILEKEELTKRDISKLGFQSSEYSPIQLINSKERIEPGFLFDTNTFVQSIELAKNLAHYATDKKKGLIIFEDNNHFKNSLNKQKVNYELYNNLNIKVAFSDLDERVLLETMSLKDNEKAIVSAFLEFRELNRENEDIGIATLDGSNWMSDIFHTNPVTLSQQFNIPEYNIRLIKTKLIQFKKLSILDDEKSSIKEIIKKVESGATVVIDVNEEQKKIIKLALNLNSTCKLNIIDNSYLKCNNLTYLLYKKQLLQEELSDFNNLIINKYSYHLRDFLADTTLYTEELKLLSVEFILIAEDKFPILITNEEHKVNETAKPTKMTSTSTTGFF